MSFATYGRETTTTIHTTDLIEQTNFCFGELHTEGNCQCQGTIFDHDGTHEPIGDFVLNSHEHELPFEIINLDSPIERNLNRTAADMDYDFNVSVDYNPFIASTQTLRNKK